MIREVEDDKYIHFEDGKILNKITGNYVGRDNGWGYLRFRDMNDGKLKLVHRVIYEKFVGPIPEGIEVNHIDLKKDNNCVSNLNLMTRQQNLQWTHKRKANTSGHKNIHWYKYANKYQVKIGNKHYGLFNNIEDAIKKRDKTIEELNEQGHTYLIM